MNNRTTAQAPAFFATLQIEVNNLTPTESRYAERLATLVDTIPVTDCRILVGQVKAIAAELQLDMVIGCGGSHIWIHRKAEFFCGENTKAENIRFAIIRDKL